MLKTRRNRILALGMALEHSAPPSTAMILRDALEREYPERYKRYDKWYKHLATLNKFIKEAKEG